IYSGSVPKSEVTRRLPISVSFTPHAIRRRWGGSFPCREGWEGRVVGEDPGDPLELAASSVRDSTSVAARDLGASLLVDVAGVVPGRQRGGDDVLKADDREAVAPEERRPVCDELGSTVVEDGPERAVVLCRREGVQGKVGKADMPAGAQQSMQL